MSGIRAIQRDGWYTACERDNVQYEAPGAKRPSWNSCHLYSRPTNHLVKCFILAPSPRECLAQLLWPADDPTQPRWSWSRRLMESLRQFALAMLVLNLFFHRDCTSAASSNSVENLTFFFSSDSPGGTVDSRTSPCWTVSLHLLGSGVIPDASPSDFRRCRTPSASAVV